jgi:cytochrome c551/c552
MIKYKSIAAFGIFLSVLFCVFTASTAAQKGKEIFESNRCGLCHKAEKKGSFPSIKEIAQAYHGNVDQLIDYFQGKTKPKLNPEKAKLMEKYLEKTKAMSSDDRQSLANYILGHQKR